MLIEAYIHGSNDTVTFGVDDLVAIATDSRYPGVTHVRLIGNISYEIIANIESLSRHKMFGAHEDYRSVVIIFDLQGEESALTARGDSRENWDKLDLDRLYTQFEDDISNLFEQTAHSAELEV